MNQVFICLVLCGTVYAGRLENLYLPPTSRQNVATAPTYPTPSNRYIPSTQNNYNRAPSRQYLSPVKSEIVADRRTFGQPIPPSVPSRQYLTPNNQYSRINQGAANRQYIPPTEQRDISNRQHIAPVPQYTPSRNHYSAPSAYRETQRTQYVGPTTDVSNTHSQNSYNQVQIVRSANNPNAGDGSYQYAYETANGISAEEQGSYGSAKGSFGYSSPEGEQVSVEYTADENGFHPRGSHLPTSPPIPEEIRKSIEQNLAEEARSGYPERPYNEQAYDSVTIEAARQNGGYRY